MLTEIVTAIVLHHLQLSNTAWVYLHAKIVVYNYKIKYNNYIGENMSNIPEGSIPIPNMTGFPTFLFVIDGQIADITVVNPSNERKVACLSSNPTVYVLEGGFPESGIVPQLDSRWP